jgi:hypothetical protein
LAFFAYFLQYVLQILLHVIFCRREDSIPLGSLILS